MKLITPQQLKNYAKGSLIFTSGLTIVGLYVERETSVPLKYKRVFFENSIYGICVPFSLLLPYWFQPTIYKYTERDQKNTFELPPV